MSDENLSRASKAPKLTDHRNVTSRVIFAYDLDVLMLLLHKLVMLLLLLLILPLLLLILRLPVAGLEGGHGKPS